MTGIKPGMTIQSNLACAELPHEARPLLQNINFLASAL
jgi:hypothetical protein